MGPRTASGASCWVFDSLMRHAVCPFSFWQACQLVFRHNWCDSLEPSNMGCVAPLFNEQSAKCPARVGQEFSERQPTCSSGLGWWCWGGLKSLECAMLAAGSCPILRGLRRGSPWCTRIQMCWSCGMTIQCRPYVSIWGADCLNELCWPYRRLAFRTPTRQAN